VVQPPSRLISTFKSVRLTVLGSNGAPIALPATASPPPVQITFAVDDSVLGVAGECDVQWDSVS
jgi:hypothetical protein